jgi:hypothetical protein
MTLPVLYRPPSTAAVADYISLDGWSASAVDEQGTEWWLAKLDGWHGSPDGRLSTVDRPADHGQFDGPTYLTSRVITASGTAIATDRTGALLARDIVSSLCWDPSRLYTLRVTEPGRPTRRASVRLNTGIKVAEVSDVAFDFQIQWKAPDPRRYADIETILTLSPPTGAVGGITYPLTVPFSFNTTGLSTSSATAVNAGTIATRPLVILHGPLVDPQIGNVSAQRTLSFLLTIAGGDSLTVDFDRRTVLLNGTASRASALTATAAWWELAPGGNDLQFTAGGGDGLCEVRYRSSWL